MIDVDLHGVFYCCNAALPYLEAQGGGKVITSHPSGEWWAHRLFPIPAYNAAKSALVNSTREIGLEYYRRNIRFNAFYPGYYCTNLAAGAYQDADFVAAITAITQQIHGPASWPHLHRIA